MNVTPLFSDSLASRPFWLLILALIVALEVSCGGSGNSAPPRLSGTTAVTLLLSSTANDQLSQFEINLDSFSLISKSGKKVDLFTTQQNPEFIHLNGKLEPLLTVSVPQDTYTAANIAVGDSSFACVTLSPSGGLVISSFAYMNIDTPTAVQFAAPIIITGSAMALSLDLQVSQSASLPSSCAVQGITPFSITPTFNLTPVSVATQVTEPEMHGKVLSVNASSNSFTVALAGGAMRFPHSPSADGQQLSFLTNSKTLYEGASRLSTLSPDMLITLDAVIQPDGSHLATRTSVADADTTNLSATTGALLQVSSSGPTMLSFGQQSQGYLHTDGQAGQQMPYSLDNADFRIAEVANLHNLPFVPQFTAATIFAGQNVYVSMHATQLQNWPTYFPATTITLIPQTMNGTITGVSSDGGFTTYNVTLAPYELIPTLAVQPGQTTVLTAPNNMVVYADSHTLRLNTQPLTVGSVVRFRGLVFNDNGIARMDCVQVDDGVAVEPVGAAVMNTARLGAVSSRVSYDRATGNVKMIHKRIGRAHSPSVLEMP